MRASSSDSLKSHHSPEVIRAIFGSRSAFVPQSEVVRASVSEGSPHLRHGLRLLSPAAVDQRGAGWYGTKETINPVHSTYMPSLWCLHLQRH